MISRRVIINGENYVHAVFRCHNRSFFFKPFFIKKIIIMLWAKYKRKYGVKIYEFNILDNHAHLLMKTRDAESLSNFMRTVNSQISRTINSHFNRDSQAIKDRYKSPVILGKKYFIKVMQYIWINRYKVDRKNPLTDVFCSASWRLNSNIIGKLVNSEKEKRLVNNLLDGYEGLNFNFPKNMNKFIKTLLQEAVGQSISYFKDAYKSVHTVSDKLTFEYRQQLVNAFRRQNTGPPMYISDPIADG